MANKSTPYSTEDVDRVLASAYVIVILFGVVGNSVVIAVVRATRAMHTTTNYLLVNLAVGDLLTLLWCLPYKVLVFLFEHPQGILGDYICKFFTSYNVTVITLTVSIFTLTVLAVERFRALLKPMHSSLRLDRDTVWYAVAAIWVFATAFMVPLFVVTRYRADVRSCRVVWPSKGQEDIYSMCIMVFSIFVPLVITVICYLRIIKGVYFSNTICAAPAGYTHESDLQEKRKIVKMLLIVTSVFILCFLPYATFRIVVASADESDYERYARLQKLREIFKFLCYSSSSFNPVIYAFQSSNYRAACKKVLLRSCGRGGNALGNSIESATMDLRTLPSKGSVLYPATNRQEQTENPEN